MLAEAVAVAEAEVAVVTAAEAFVDAVLAVAVAALAVVTAELAVVTAELAVGVAELSATGTASNSTFLRGDNAWVAVDALPSQSGNSGKFLTTDATDASWATISTVFPFYKADGNADNIGVL